MYPGSKGRKNKRAMTIAIQGSNSRSTTATVSPEPISIKRKSDSSFIPASPTEIHDTNNCNDEKPWTWDQPYYHDIPPVEDSDPWEKCYELTKKHDDDLIDAWRDEVEHLLIFAGLFSAVVTAFAIDSYKGLQPDAMDATVVLLAQIATQLGANSSLAQSISSTSLPLPSTSLNVQLNVFYFLSLTLSISTVLIGILCLQWLQEYDHDIGLPHKDSVALRQMRYEGLVAWDVPRILSALPVILQVALVLFFIGLLELLWSLDVVVASLVTVAVGLTLLFLVATTIIPTLQYFLSVHDYLQVPQCPYKSPQSWVFHRLVRRVVWLASRSHPTFLSSIWTATRRRLRYVESLEDENWGDYDTRWHNIRNALNPDRDTINALTWIEKKYAVPRIDVIQTTAHCFRDVSPEALTHEQILPHEVVKGLKPSSGRNEVAITFFLERHRTRHPELSIPHLASVIRAINSDTTLIPYHRWPIHNLSELPNDVIAQFLMSVKTLVSSNRVVSSKDVDSIWDLIQFTLSRRMVSSNEEDIRWKRIHSRVSFEIMDQLQLFSNRLIMDAKEEAQPENSSLQAEKVALHSIHNMEPGSSDSKYNSPTDIVIACAHGLIRVFPILNQEEMFSQFNDVPTWKVDMVHKLNTCVVRLGGAPYVFGPTVRKLWEKLLHHTLPHHYSDVKDVNASSEEHTDSQSITVGDHL